MELRDILVDELIYSLNLDRSSIPPIPITFPLSEFIILSARYVSGSNGFVTTITIDSGEYVRTLLHTSFTIPAFVLSKSILVIPGFLPIPATITTQADFFIS